MGMLLEDLIPLIEEEFWKYCIEKLLYWNYCIGTILFYIILYHIRHQAESQMLLKMSKNDKKF